MTRGLDRLRGTVVASDPSNHRLRLAIRGVLSLGLAAVSVWLLSRALGQPVLAGAPAVIVAMSGTIATNGPGPRWRAATIALCAVTAISGAALAAALAPHTLASRIVFVVLSGVAVAAQAFGQRGMAAGLLAFMAYFIALFLHVPVATLWWTALAIAAGAAVTAVAQLLVPEPPASDLRPFVRAFRARAGAIERAAVAVSARGTSHARSRLRGRVFDLRETALAFDDRIADDDGDLRDVLLDATLAAERVSELALASRETDGARDALHELEERLARCARERRAARERRRPYGGPPRNVLARKVVQAMLATAVAVPLGEVVSTQRWYWAALGAFVVFTRPETAGETVARGAERLVGTTAGAAAGIAIGSALAGHRPAQFVVLGIALFLTLYAFPLSYAVAMAGITTVLAILYDLLGVFSDELLGLRVAETAIGVTLGGLAAALVLPTSTRAKVERAERELLGDVNAFVGELRERLDGGSADVYASARAVERDAQTLREAAQPIARPLPGLGSAARRRRNALLASLGRSARSTAAALRTDRPGAEERERLLQELDAVARALAEPHAAVDEAPDDDADDRPAVDSLRRMRRALAALADDG